MMEIKFTEKQKKYLIDLLGSEEAKDLESAIRQDQLIIVAGRQGPTGKSTLYRFLKKKGVKTIEAYQTHEIVLDTLLIEKESLKLQSLFNE